MRYHAFHPEDDQGQPDHRKTDQFTGCERFLIDQHTQQELHGGGNVLHNANHRQWDALYRRCKHQQRDSCHYASARHQQISLDAFTVATDYGEVRQPEQAAGPPIVPTKKTEYAAGTEFGAYINTGSTGAATFEMDVFGYLY